MWVQIQVYYYTLHACKLQLNLSLALRETPSIRITILVPQRLQLLLFLTLADLCGITQLEELRR